MLSEISMLIILYNIFFAMMCFYFLFINVPSFEVRHLLHGIDLVDLVNGVSYEISTILRHSLLNKNISTAWLSHRSSVFKQRYVRGGTYRNISQLQENLERTSEPKAWSRVHVLQIKRAFCWSVYQLQFFTDTGVSYQKGPASK
jgi:hypothetical protein